VRDPAKRDVVILIFDICILHYFLPTGLFNAGYIAFGRKLPEAYPAKIEVAHIAALPAAAEAAPHYPRREFRRFP